MVQVDLCICETDLLQTDTEGPEALKLWRHNTLIHLNYIAMRRMNFLTLYSKTQW